MRNRWWVTTALAAATLTVAACGSTPNGSTASPGGSANTPSASAPASGGGSARAANAANGVKTASIGGATVLTNARGFTLYWFAPDTPAMSKCTSTCAQYWPPVTGPVTESGIKGSFGTIKRPGGSVQATYNGHPLYTYVADTAPGQAKGNNLDASGGLWHEVTVTGSAPAASSSSSSKSGGYGY